MEYKYEHVMHSKGFPVNVFATCIDACNYHWHPEIEILFVLSGTIYLSIGKDMFHMKNGDIILINSNDVHRVVGTENNTVLICQIKPDYCKDYYDNLSSIRFNFQYNKYDDKDIKGLNIRVSLVKIFKEMQKYDNGKESYLVIHSILDKLVSDLLIGYGYESRSMKAISCENRDLLIVKNFLKYVSENYQNKISISYLAEKQNFSLSYFSTFIKGYLGMSISEYINQYRVDKAKELLMFSDDNISEVAMKTGFCDLKMFISKFKKRFNMTPGTYKKKYSLSNDEEKEIALKLLKRSNNYSPINSFHIDELIKKYSEVK